MKLSSLEAIVSALRATFDVDLVVQLLPDNIARAINALASLGYRPTAPVPASQFADAGHRESWIRDKNMVVFQLRSDRHPETSIDLFVTEPFEFDKEYERALVGDMFPEVTLRFVSLDTLIRMKEAAGRPKDLEDMRQLRLLARGG